MYNRIGSKRKSLRNIEDEPPERKLVSDADMYIKKLAEQQTSTKTTLHEQLTMPQKQFYKALDFVPLSNYAAGTSSLNEFNKIEGHCNEIEKLKSLGLNDEQIQLYFDSENGLDFLKTKHRLIDDDILQQQIENIKNLIENERNIDEKVEKPENRLEKEMLFSEKPTSIETKLLKFALDNRIETKSIPHPMDNLKELESHFTKTQELFETVNVKKIRKKARQLQRQIDSINDKPMTKPLETVRNTGSCLIAPEYSKWDKKIEDNKNENVEKNKIYTCMNKPNLYTIKNGQIVKINSESNCNKKLSVEEIKKLDRFENYDAGKPSNILYIKNLANKVEENDLKNILGNELISLKLLKGKMRGQAFAHFSTTEAASQCLLNANGIFVKSKPIIIQFSNKTSD